MNNMVSHSGCDQYEDELCPPERDKKPRRHNDADPQQADGENLCLQWDAFALAIVPDVFAKETVVVQPGEKPFGAVCVTNRSEQQQRCGWDNRKEDADETDCQAERANENQEGFDKDLHFPANYAIEWRNLPS